MKKRGKHRNRAEEKVEIGEKEGGKRWKRGRKVEKRGEKSGKGEKE